MEVLEHFEQASSRDRVDAGGWFVEEFALWRSDERHGADKLSFVASAELSGFGIRKFLQVQSLLNKLGLELDILTFDPLHFTHKSDAFIDTHHIPNGVSLCAHSHLIAVSSNIDFVDVIPK